MKYHRHWTERRCSGRVATALRAWYRSDAGAYERAVATEISLTGAQLYVRRALQPGSCLDLQLKAGAQDPYVLRATVVWVQLAPGGGYRAGVSLHCYLPADARRLRRWHHQQELRRSA